MECPPPRTTQGREGCCSSFNNEHTTAKECPSRKSPRIWRKTALTWVHRKTADVVQDYPALNALDEPSLRPTARLFVTALAIIGAIISVSFIYQNSKSSQTVRHWGSSYLLTLPTSQQNYPNLLCPCNKSSIPWPYYISFYWIDQSVGQASSWNRYPISNYTQFCDPLHVVTADLTTGAWLQGCYLMAQTISSFTNITMRTTVSTNSITAPSVLGHIISIQMQDAIADVFENYAYLSASSFADWLQLLNVKQMLDSAAYRLVMSTKSMDDKNTTNDFYWRFFKGVYYTSPPNGTLVKAFDLTRGRALVLEMNWTAYVKQCSPPYCDEVVRSSLLHRIMTAIIQVGGFAALTMIVLRCAVWPCIRYLNRWS